MKHYYMLGLAMAGLLSLPSYGQGGVHQFPKPFTPATAFAAPAWAPETPSLVPSAIDDKSEGVTIYACERMDADLYASFSDGHHTVSFDRVVEVMRQTGHDLPSLYKETSEGGLAKGFPRDI